MGGPVLADEFEQRAGVGARAAVHGAARRSRMHEIVVCARHVAVVDEEVLLDRQPRIAALEVAGA